MRNPLTNKTMTVTDPNRLILMVAIKILLAEQAKSKAKVVGITSLKDAKAKQAAEIDAICQERAK